MNKIYILSLLTLSFIFAAPELALASVTPEASSHIEPGAKPMAPAVKKSAKLNKKNVAVKKEKDQPAPKQLKKHHDSGKKSFLIALLLCIIGGYLGLHRFYLGYPILGTIYFFTGGILLIGWIIDLFLFKAEKLNPKGKKDFDTI